ncbi:hypothetical protein GOP47_0014391 [Adiantum capillus-veneris]|uniref:NADP-dependent oxidoreductase domain-containing protein n=1 Tax=Adiantum capillus-veneris TaxID=13818 RepID=A0A9D4ULD7_ADICA|nr:hypothetical protein GOP47_0014391 [Adiantum capillus-veneris]
MAECAVLNTGASMPLVGLDTGSNGALPLDQRKAVISAAVEVGYRHFDTAKIYNSEGFLGEALKEAMEAGLVKREDLFVTSKLWCTDAYPDRVLPALRNSLSALQLDYLDLYLIHWPIRLKEGADRRPKPDELMALDLQGTWRALEACVKQGLVRAIGVSNFSSKKIMELLEFAEIPPAVNQVEMHPQWQQRLLRETCKKANVHVCAWSPLGAPLMSWGTPEILNNPIIKDIASKHGKSPAQVVLRWGLDNGVSVIPKSFNKKRMVENLDVFGWHLTDEDHQRISGIEQKKNFDGSFICSQVSGPYKSPEDLWDGEFGL